MSALTSAAVPPIGPRITSAGDGRTVVVYMDLGCPHCAAAGPRSRSSPCDLVFRHFPWPASTRALPRFTPRPRRRRCRPRRRLLGMVDSIYADRGRVDDPHLWERAARTRARPGAIRA